MYIHIYMRRKLVKQGPQSLVVTLPTRWITENNLRKGREVIITESENKLIIAATEEQKLRPPYVLNITDCAHYYIIRTITMAYRLGYDEMQIHNEKRVVTHLRKNKPVPTKKFMRELTRRFIGMEIVSENEEKVIIKCFTAVTPEEAKNVQRRIFLLLKEFMEKISSQKKYDPEEEHDRVAKFINYYFRILHTTTTMSNQEKMLLYSLFSVQDKIADVLRHCSILLAKIKKPEEKTRELLKEIFDFYNELYVFFYDPAKEEKRKIVQKRYALVKKVETCKASPEETKLLFEAKFILEIINDFYECAIGLKTIQREENKS